MKISFFVIVFLWFRPCQAQRISYNDLIYVLNHNVAESEEFLSKKRFEFHGVDTLSGKEMPVSYMFTKNPSSEKSYISVDKKSIQKIFYGVSLFTTYQSDYLQLKAFIKNLGYSLVETEVDNGSLVTTYRKGFLEVEFTLAHNSKYDFNDYYISVTNKIKERAARQLSKQY